MNRSSWRGSQSIKYSSEWIQASTIEPLTPKIKQREYTFNLIKNSSCFFAFPLGPTVNKIGTLEIQLRLLRHLMKEHRV